MHYFNFQLCSKLCVACFSGDLILTTASDPQKIVKTLKGGHTATVRCLHWDNSVYCFQYHNDVLKSFYIHYVLFLKQFFKINSYTQVENASIANTFFLPRVCIIKEDFFYSIILRRLNVEKQMYQRNYYALCRRLQLSVSYVCVTKLFSNYVWRPTRC